MNKINIFCNNDQKFRNGYINIDMSCQTKRADILKMPPAEMETYFENGEVDEVLVDECLDFLTWDQREKFIGVLKSKLCRGGEICISFIDFEELTRKYSNGKIQFKELNDTLFSQNGLNKVSVSTSRSIVELLAKNKFAVSQISFSDAIGLVRGVSR